VKSSAPLFVAREIPGEFGKKISRKGFLFSVRAYMIQDFQGKGYLRKKNGTGWFVIRDVFFCMMN
jgi:hypothetical protein